ncbi:V-type immunoglobulin domain-containing suppressor of T-cell activation isoform X2 [Sardina pilchardus]|uniref:V-type immunoglobulin domain-containing suppressor of T-cell activation isoform X2 n=1 Tax=Sardina pilchardus TaxID=27697 RepID=UPI002E13A080
MDFRIVAALFVVAVLTQGSSSIGVVDDEARLTAPHQHYACPAGANVTLMCEQHGHPHSGDQFHAAWLYTPHLDRHCQKGQHPRQGRIRRTNHSLPLSSVGVYMLEGSRIMLHLTDVQPGDQGRYCCLVAEKHHKGTLHSHVLLTVGPAHPGSLTCTEMNPNSNSDGKVTAVFATAACIMAFLCLPLILVLVYRQRQTAQANRRAHELVRMDSEAQGHDNPVFLAGSPQAKTRTVSQIMTRQSSETGRHLLSDPGTPMTPNAFGDVFFPTQEPIPESPNFLQV